MPYTVAAAKHATMTSITDLHYTEATARHAVICPATPWSHATHNRKSAIPCHTTNILLFQLPNHANILLYYYNLLSAAYETAKQLTKKVMWDH